MSIPAPPFGESERAEWFLERFREVGLSEAACDAEGNALAWLRPWQAGEPLVLLSAHLDTVFPAGTDIHLIQEDAVLRGPGACDNGAGLAALLALASVAMAQPDAFVTNILFAANVGEEAEGDLRGMRQLFQKSAFRGDILASVALEGAGTETLVTRALGSRRFRVMVTGPGGHAWTDVGTPNPLLVLAAALQRCAAEPLPRHPRTTLNVGRLEGGTSVTSIPESATALVDVRSMDADEILRLEVLLYRSVEDAVIEANQNANREANRGADGAAAPVRFRIERIGDRPAGELAAGSPLRRTVQAVDRHLRLRTEERIGSTDANLPLAMGRDGIAMGCGGKAGGIHTMAEWYDSSGRELALRRLLLVLLDLCSEGYRVEAGWNGDGRRLVPVEEEV